MKRLIYHIIRLALVLLPVILTVTPVAAQKPVPVVEVSQCEDIILSVEQMPGDTYTWDLFKDPTVDFAQEPVGDVLPEEAYFVSGNTGPSVTVALVQPGRYFYRVMAYDSVMCTNNLEIGILEVIESLPTATLTGDSICIGDPAEIGISLTGDGPWDITYTYGDGTDLIEVNDITDPELVISIPPGLTTDTEFWVTEVTDSCSTNTTESERAEVKVYPNPINSRIYQVDK